jgi:hypothetical protein
LLWFYFSEQFVLEVLQLPFGSVAIAQEVCEGDFNCDGKVFYDDLTVFAADYGRSDCPPSVPCDPAPVEKTGQTTSYATGDDGDLEKGVTWPPTRFTDNGDDRTYLA